MTSLASPLLLLFLISSIQIRTEHCDKLATNVCRLQVKELHRWSHKQSTWTKCARSMELHAVCSVSWSCTWRSHRHCRVYWRLQLSPSLQIRHRSVPADQRADELLRNWSRRLRYDAAHCDHLFSMCNYQCIGLPAAIDLSATTLR